MQTRGDLYCSHPDNIQPWHLPAGQGERGRLIGGYPGYGRGLIRGGFIPLEAGLYRGGQLFPGFGVAMDPSDPSTWQRPVRFT